MNHEADKQPEDQLDETLRRAVDQMRNQRPPSESMQRSLDQARRLDAVTTPWFRRAHRKMALAVTGLAAALLIGGSWLLSSSDAPYSYLAAKKVPTLHPR